MFYRDGLQWPYGHRAAEDPQVSEPALLSTVVYSLSPKDVANIPLDSLPLFIRVAEEARDKADGEWFSAFQHYKQTRLQLAIYYHEELKLGIRAAEFKAETDPNVVEVGINARAARDRLRAITSVVDQLKRIFEVKIGGVNGCQVRTAASGSASEIRRSIGSMLLAKLLSRRNETTSAVVT
jgi:hypothetical protein